MDSDEIQRHQQKIVNNISTLKEALVDMFKMNGLEKKMYIPALISIIAESCKSEVCCERYTRALRELYELGRE